MNNHPLIVLGALAIVHGCGSGCKESSANPPTLKDAQQFLQSQPRYLRPVPYTPVPTGLADLRAETCGACHREIYDEWRISTHARAWLDDAQFQEELAKSRKQNVDWACNHCHTPLENQLPRLVAGLEEGAIDRPIFVDNPNFDPKLQNDAITCAVCHVRDGVVLGPYGDTKAPHPVKKEDNLLKPEVCTQCHQAKARFDEVGLICAFDTGQEYEASPNKANGEVCQTCHMPKVERPLMAGFPARTTRRHWFGGSLIPKKPEYAEQMADLRKHYPPGLTASWKNLPKTLASDRPTTITATYTNANSGHKLPTGDPERFIIVELEAVDGQGTRLGHAETRIGIVYEWHPIPKLISDNRLAPQETRTLELPLKPVSGPVTLHLRASRWRINQENFDYHELEGRYVAGQTFLQTSVTLPTAATSNH